VDGLGDGIAALLILRSVGIFVCFFSVCLLSVVSSFRLAANGFRLCVVADFQHKSSIEELHLNLPQNCHTKHCTRHYAKPMLVAGVHVVRYLFLLSIFVSQINYLV
jgi:hypothetical protein